MFKNLTNFGYKRSRKEAFGFYVAWLLVCSLTAGAVAMAAAFIFFPNVDDFKEGFAIGSRIGAFVAIIISVTFATLIAKEKSILTHFSTVFLLILTALLATLGGGFLGLIIPAYLSTRPIAHVVKVVAEEKSGE